MDGAVAIEATATSRDGGEALLRALEGMGLREGKAYKSMIFGYLPVDKLKEISKLSELRYARPYYKPATNVGAVTSQGDVALRADVARTTYGVNGAGSKGGYPVGLVQQSGWSSRRDSFPAIYQPGVQVLAEFG